VEHGDTVQVLEHWVRTSKGWLPVLDGHGQVLFEAVPGGQEAPRRVTFSDIQDQKKGTRLPLVGTAEPPVANKCPELGHGEEEWGERFARLQERFSDAPAGIVLRALRSNDGHAGKAASSLREWMYHNMP
jgi:hypothetical protein